MLCMKTSITFLIISRAVLLRMGNVSGKSRRESQNTHFVFSTFFFFFENRAVYDIMSEKCCVAGKATVDSVAHAHFMLST